jgi:hypothetical protein
VGECLEDDRSAAPHRFRKGNGGVRREATPGPRLVGGMAEGAGNDELGAVVVQQGEDAGVGVQGGKSLGEDDLGDLFNGPGVAQGPVRVSRRGRRSVSVCRSASAAVALGGEFVIISRVRNLVSSAIPAPNRIRGRCVPPAGFAGEPTS